jgi:hypothetical protein
MGGGRERERAARGEYRNWPACCIEPVAAFKMPPLWRPARARPQRQHPAWPGLARFLFSCRSSISSTRPAQPASRTPFLIVWAPATFSPSRARQLARGLAWAAPSYARALGVGFGVVVAAPLARAALSPLHFRLTAHPRRRALSPQRQVSATRLGDLAADAQRAALRPHAATAAQRRNRGAAGAHPRERTLCGLPE